METFLTEVARRLRADYPEGLEQVTVVFNNRRSGLFLRRQFSQMDGQPFLLPRIIGIDELVADLGGLEIVPNEFLLFELFDIHRRLGGEERRFDTFEEFISFGDMMLADFSEIDLYQADAQQLFSNLRDLKVLGEWDIERGSLTPFQERYLAFYHSLYNYYSQLHQRLLRQGKAYSGMAYRHVAENIESLTARRPQQPYCFVGFNALSTCEKNIIRHYLEEGSGRLYADGDAYYFDDPMQEAGHFLRKHQPLFGDGLRFDDHFAQGHKEITLISCPESVMQCKYASQLLAQQVRENADDPIEQTALVLADEGLLVPALNSLPAEIKTANITMGYPFRNTETHALMLNLLSLHQRRHSARFYHADIRDLLCSPVIAQLLQTDDIHAKVSQTMAREHIVYADREELAGLCHTVGCDFATVEYLFTPAPPTPDDLLAAARSLILQLHQSNALKDNCKEQEALGVLLKITDHFIGLQQDYHFIENLSVLSKIYTRLAQRCSVPFYGEPLTGLQILGVLETRNLDFRRVILLSANEGVFPANKTANTLIPYNLKVAFGIPTYHDKEAVYAYNFYRLLQRADEVHILYSTESDGMGKGEPSRFVLQVRDELSLRYPQHISLHEETLSVSNRGRPAPIPDCYKKDAQSMALLASLSARGFSPSALNKYRNCPLRFYYEDIQGIRENESLNEDLEQNEIGECIHAVLEDIYSRDKGGIVQSATLRSALSEIDSVIDRALQEQFLHGRRQEGRNHFYRSVAKMQLTHFLRSEIKELDRMGDGSLQILGLEEPLSAPLAIEVCGQEQRVNLAGRADRIDCCEGIVRIIDYKSGRADDNELVVPFQDPDIQSVPDKWFQVMTYAWLYKRSHRHAAPLRSGIVALRRSSSPLLPAVWGQQDLLDDEAVNRFESLLARLLSDIMNPDVPFFANHRSKSCKICSFQRLCQWGAAPEAAAAAEADD